MIIGLEKEVAGRWKKAVGGLIDAYVDEMKKTGVNGREIVDYTMKAIDKYSR